MEYKHESIQDLREKYDVKEVCLRDSLKEMEPIMDLLKEVNASLHTLHRFVNILDSIVRSSENIAESRANSL